MISASGRIIYPYCSVPMCNKNPKHSCFRLPTNPATAKLWMKITGITDTSRLVYVCEAHFERPMIHGNKRKRLVKGTLPTLNLPFSKPETDNNPMFVPKAQSNYNDLVEDVIIQSLQPSGSQTKSTTSIESSHKAIDLREESTSTSANMKQDKNSGDANKVKKKQKIRSKEVQTSFKEPDYAARTIVELQKELDDISKLPDVFQELALNIYLINPQGYETLHNTLCLPPVSVLKDMFKNCSITTDDNTIFAKSLLIKVNMMPEKLKHCVICLGQIHVKPNLYYDIKSDKLLGIVDVNDIQKPERASSALVLTAQGLFADWKQPIAVAYLGTPDNIHFTNIKQWVEKNIRNLIKIGFNVRALVSETNYLETRYLPYFEISEHKIYYIYDVPHLFKLFYYNFFTHDYSFDGGVAKMEHLLKFIKLDVKKELRLLPKVNETHVKSTLLQDVTVKQVQEVISLETAAAMSMYIDFGALNKTAISTVQLIKKMSTLFEVLHSQSLNDSIRLSSGQMISAVQFLRVMLPFFNNFKFIDCITKEEVPKEQGSFTDNINHTIKAVLLLYADLDKDSESLPIRRLSLDNLRLFFHQVTKLGENGTRPTCKLINLAFTQSLLLNLLKPTSDVKFVNLEIALEQIKNIISRFKTQDGPKIGYFNCNTDTSISSSEYNTLDLQKKNAVVLLAGFMLKKCYDRHADCVAMKNYICIVRHDTSSICKMILNEIQRGICVVPQENFIEFVEMMEIKFRSCMTKDILETQNGRLLSGLMKAMQPLNFPMPCPCFPIFYAKKLYLRLRIYTTLTYNNKNYSAQENCKAMLLVNNL